MKWEGSVKVQCDVLSVETKTQVLSKPLGIVLTPTVSEVEVVMCCVCLKLLWAFPYFHVTALFIIIFKIIFVAIHTSSHS